MAKILTGTKVPNADHYTIKYTKKSNNEDILIIENVEGATSTDNNFYFNLTETKITALPEGSITTVENSGGIEIKNYLIPGEEYEIRTQACPENGSSLWENSDFSSPQILNFPSATIKVKLDNSFSDISACDLYYGFTVNEDGVVFEDEVKSFSESKETNISCNKKENLYIQLQVANEIKAISTISAGWEECPSDNGTITILKRNLKGISSEEITLSLVTS